MEEDEDLQMISRERNVNKIRINKKSTINEVNIGDTLNDVDIKDLPRIISSKTSKVQTQTD
jgi:hypothetical protein